MARLTKRSVEALTPATSDFIVFDDDLPGFGIRVFPSGRRSFLVQYRSGGRTRRIKIGHFGTLTTDEARQQARQLLGDVAKGENPAQEIHDQRRAPTVAAMCDRFLSDYVAMRCKPSTARQYERIIDKHIRPAFGTHKIVDISRSDIAALHHDLRRTPYEANRVLALLSKLFNTVELWEVRPDGSNPCRHVRRYREDKRERFLMPDEIRHLGKVLDEVEADGTVSPQAVAAFRLLILTGCRCGEILTLKWDYIDTNYLRLPDSKTGSRKIPIGPAHWTVLNNIPRAPDNPYVVTGLIPGRHLAGLNQPWRRIRERAGFTGLRIHDLRHTYASNALASGLSIEMVGKLLGHTQLQTTMRYAHIADDPLRDAAAQVSNQLGSLMIAPTHQPPPTPDRTGAVVPFPPNRAIG
mgnify:CR=1 FL=1